MRTWVEISQDALRNNIAGLKSILEPGVVFCAVVKAFAYGHGIAPVVRICLEEGIAHFAVDAIHEAEEVRRVAGEQASIFLLGMQMAEEYERVVRARAIQTVSSPEEIVALGNVAKRLGMPVQVTLEIETGLYRLGAQERVVHAMMRALAEWKGWVFVQSVASHFASSEDASAEWETKRQNTIFCDAIVWLKAQGIYAPYHHISCSAATLLDPHMQHSMVRLGIMLYGLWPSPDVRRQGTLGKRHVQLSPVLSWKTHLVHVQDIPPGAAIGYGGSFKANRPMRIGVIPVGYYDGLDRRAGNKGFVVVRGTRCPIVGRICMNMCMIDIGGAPAGTKAGDEVTLIGREGLGTVTADEWAQAWGTVHYEVVTRISQHLPRIVV
jgi:alanine racemase